MHRYFRCTSNPSGPLLVLETEWEADEMKTNREDTEVDETGFPVIVSDEATEKDFE